MSSHGITSSPGEVCAVKIWREALHNDTQVKQFLNTVTYCCMLLNSRFADTARGLTESTIRGVLFVWTDKHTAAVKALKHALCSYFVLQTLDFINPHILKTDAFDNALGAVLEQKGKL